MNFAASQRYLYSLGNEVEAMKLGLDNIRTLLAELGNPQEKYLKVQVAGTNGKGSVCAFLDSICGQADIRRGLYTSPHLVSITERIKIDGEDISEDDFAGLATTVRTTSERLLAEGKLQYTPTFFEQVTAIALIAFAEAKVELAILETGLGGRLDATTAADAEIAAITQIDLDHQEYLGDTIEEIAAEKAAIIRCGSVVCIGKQIPEAFEVILDRCSKVGVTPATLRFARFGRENEGAYFNMNDFQCGEVMLSLPGDHQIENAALAVLIAKQLPSAYSIANEDICKGLERAEHSGRLEWVEVEGIRILLDGAHNPAGAQALSQYLTTYEPGSTIVLIYGSMKEKQINSIIEALSPLARDIILTEPENARRARASEIAQSAVLKNRPDSVFVIPDIASALDSAIQLSGTYPATKKTMVLVTGSLYLVGEVRKIAISR